MRIPCDVPGHEEDWIEFDEGQWTVGDRRRFFTANDAEAMQKIIEWATDWRLTGKDGPIAFGREKEALDELPLGMWPWLVKSVYVGFQEAMSLPPL